MSKNMILILGIILIVLIIITSIVLIKNCNQKTQESQWNDIADVQSVLDDVENILMGNVDVASIQDTPYMFFYRRDIDKDFDSAEKTVKYSYVFTLHDDTDGFIKVRYSFRAVTKEGKVLNSFGTLDSTWVIHKKDGEWKIIKIFEAP